MLKKFYKKFLIFHFIYILIVYKQKIVYKMLTNLNDYISKSNFQECLVECLKNNELHLGLLLTHILKTKKTDLELKELIFFEEQFRKKINGIEIDGNCINVSENIINNEEERVYIRVKLFCNWTSSDELTDIWDKMSQGNNTWNNIKLVLEEPIDYYVVINCPPIGTIFEDKSKVILFHMEPNIPKHPELWGEWSSKKKGDLKFVGSHDVEYNNNEWHISKTYNELKNHSIEKNEDLANVLTTILSDKYKDPGHVKRIDFVKFLETKNDFPIHVYGGNKFEWKNYKGVLPYHKKDDGLFPYKYSFNVENYEIRNYFSEKLIDGILSETLVFYHGCMNISEFINPKAFVYLELLDFEKDYLIIKNSIENNLWEERLPYIKEAKEKILDELQFFPRLERIINS